MWTTWRGVAIIWFSVEGWRPQNRNMHSAGWLWISSGGLPVVEVAGATSYPDGFPLRGRGTAITTIRFEQIIWPPEVHETFLLERSIERHGGLFLVGPRDRVILGVETAAHFLGELLGVKYCRRDDAFTVCIEAGQTEPISKSRLADQIKKWLFHQVERAGITFPSGDPVADVLNALKQMHASVQLDEADGLRAFMRERIQVKVGSNLTTNEAWAGYHTFCKAHEASFYPERAFYSRFATAVRSAFGICRAHDIERAKPSGGSRLVYGYRNLGIITITPELPEPPEAPELAELPEPAGAPGSK